MELQQEKEFDPTIHTAEYVSVEPDESFIQIRDKIEAALGRTPNVILVIPRDAQAFHTTQDFLALGKLQWRREVRVAVATPDPTIAGLARVLGFHIVEPPVDHPSLAGDPGMAHSAAELEAGGPGEDATSPLPLGGLPGVPEWVISPTLPGPSTSYTPKVSTSGSLTTSTWLSMSDDGTDAQGRAGGGAKPQTRAGQPPPRRRQRQTGVLLPTQVPNLGTDPLDDENAAANAQAQDEVKARLAALESKAYKSGRGWRYSGGIRQGRIGRVVLAVMLVLLLIGGAASGYAYMYLPEGTVSVFPKSKTIADMPLYIAVATGRTNPLGTTQVEPATMPDVSAQSLTAGTIESLLVEEQTAPATGLREIPRGRGAGTMHFVNTTGQAQFVPQGTTFEGPNGVVVETTEGGNVAPTNFAAQQFGTLDLPIAATVEGPAGNLASGELQGTYGGVLTYINYAMQGGTIETVKVVLQEDIDRLVTDLGGKVEARVGSAILEKQVQGQHLITETIRLENRQVEISRQAGEDGDSVTVKVSGVATANTYDEAKMDDQLRQAVYDHIQSTEAAVYGPVTDFNSITLSEPVLQPSGGGEQGIILYAVTASARVKYTLTKDFATQIRDTVKGQSIDQARRLLAEKYKSYVDAGNIEARLFWFNLDKLPDDSSRIEIESSGNDSALR